MNALIITLVDDLQRLENALKLQRVLSEKGYLAEVFQATSYHGRDFSSINYAGSHSLEKPMTAGEIACAFSHYRACNHIVENKYWGCLIVEDDAELLHIPDASMFWSATHLVSGSAYDPLHQHDGFTITSTDEIHKKHVTKGLPYGTQSYFVTLAGARVLRDNLLPIRWASDIALDRLSKFGLLETELAMTPWAVQSGNIKSQIGQR